MGTVDIEVDITSHAVGAVIARIDTSGMVEFAVFNYKKKGRTSLRSFMETGERGERVIDTLRKGINHEVTRNVLEFDYRLWVDDPILTRLVADDGTRGGHHLKVMYLVEVTKGKLRDYELPDGDETLGPVTWIEAEAVIRRMEGNTPPFHTSSCYAALERLAVNKAVFSRYERLVSKWTPPQHTPEETTAIQAYVDR